MLIDQLARESPRGRVVGRTRLMKLIFLSQREAADAVQALTGTPAPFTFSRYLYGPFSSEVLDVMDSLALTGHVMQRSRALDEEGRVVQWEYALTDHGQALVAPLRETEAYRTLCERIVAVYGRWPTQRLLRDVYTRYLQEPA